MADKIVSDLPKATHTGTLKIGETKIACCVLKDGTRLITQSGFYGALGRAKTGMGSRISIESEAPKNNEKGSKPIQGTDTKKSVQIEIPRFLSSKNLKTLVVERFSKLDSVVNSPIQFIATNGREATGYNSDLLPEVCNIILDARRIGVLAPNQQHIADHCEMLLRAFARVGLTALIDEATGFQFIRNPDALQKLLDRYLREDLMKWTKTFPDDLYQEWYRLLAWNHLDPTAPGKPHYLAKITKRLVYDKILPNLASSLAEKRGDEKHRLHQYLSDAPGREHLKVHLGGIVALAKGCNDWDEYTRMVDRFYPDPTN